MLIGFEKEFFVTKEKEVVVVPNRIPHDDCGWLAEARSKPSGDVVEGVFSLKADEFRLRMLAIEEGLQLVATPFMKVPKEVRLAARREFSKGLTEYQNLYGHTSHGLPLAMADAGIHVSFTFSRTKYYGKKNRKFEYNPVWDYPRLFGLLDRRFAMEIKLAKRRPGFYEIKPDGRIEYRSLPNTLHFTQLVAGIQWALKECGSLL